MSELLLFGAGAILLQELISQIFDRVAWRGTRTSKVQAKNLAIRFFTILTFPLVLFMMLVAALWLLPILLLSKPYRMQLKQAAGTHASGWDHGSQFSQELSDISMPQFMLTPFKPVFSFMNWIGKRRKTPTAPAPHISIPYFIYGPAPTIRP